MRLTFSATLPALLMLLVTVAPLEAQQRKQRGRPRGRVLRNVTSHRDVEYAKVGGKALLLDVFVPKGVKQPPLLVWIHGGGWSGGSKGNGGGLLFMTSRGYAVASINYRLSHEAIFPAQIHDCKAAIRWLRANSKKYGYNAAKIGVAGSSAGGHLVALLGTSGGVAELEGKVGGNTDQSSRVQAVCDMWGPTDFLQMDAHSLAGARFRHDSPRSPESRLIGGAIQENKDKVAKANPITYVDKADPPFFILHGDRDPLVPVHQSRLLAEALKKAGVDHTLRVVKGAGHGGRQFRHPDVKSAIVAFFDKHIKGKQP